MEFNQKQTEELIAKIKMQDEEAFQTFYEEWYPKAYYIALAITHHEADAKDVAQETMIEIHRSIQNLRDLKYFKLWINRIILSKCNRIFRKKKAVTMDVELKNALMSQEEERLDFLPRDYAHKRSDVEVLQTMLMNLQPIYSEVLVLMYYEQCSIKEISDILQVPEGTVKSRLNSAKQKLKLKICEYEEKEQVKLTFHGRSLEVMLAIAYANMAEKVCGNKAAHSYRENNSAARFLSVLTSKAMIIALSMICTTCSVAAALDIYHDFQNEKEAQSVSIPEQEHVFSPVFFKNKKITNDKEAYFMLMKYAHCDEELKTLSEAERNTVDILIQQLSYEGSIYYHLWQNRQLYVTE